MLKFQVKVSSGDIHEYWLVRDNEFYGKYRFFNFTSGKICKNKYLTEELAIHKLWDLVSTGKINYFRSI